MTRPTLPADGVKPWGTIIRNAINDVSDRADTALSNATSAATSASSATSTANAAQTTANANSTALSALQTTVGTKAADNAVVHLTGNESVGGTKTFTAAPAVPDASFAIAKTNGLQAALDAKAGTSSTVLTTTDQTVAGIKTFSAAPVVPDSSFVVTKIDATTLAEFIRDTVAAFVVAGAAMTVTHDDPGNTLTFVSSAGIYAQRHWDTATSTWDARPAVPAGVSVTSDSSLDVDATPPPSSLRYDRWYPHPSSAYWPA